MKRKREIILDFTSLLDVIMIILFFFILFSHIETIDAKSRYEAAMSDADAVLAEADERMQAAESRMEEAKALHEEAQTKLDNLEEENPRSAANIDGIAEFSKGLNLRLQLTAKGDSWSVSLCRADQGSESFAEISYGTAEAMAQSITHALGAIGYTKQDTILAIFVYDGNLGGSKAAYDKLHDAFDRMKKEYKYLYISDLDISGMHEGS